MNDRSSDFDEAVRLTAYFLWEQEGRPPGQEQHFWERALEQHLRERAYDLWLSEGEPTGRDEEIWDKARGGMP